MALATLVQQNEVSDVEWAARCDLAALYRIFDNMRMTDLVYTHLSARVPDDPDCFLMNQYGEMFDEVTASSLVKMDLDGNMIGKQGAFNSAGFTIHSACYLARQNVNAVIHLHTKASIAVASVKNGLIPMSQHSLYVINDLAYHDYEGPATNLDERESLGRNLADKNNMLLVNHGSLSVGRTIPEAFRNSYYLEKSCDIQVAAQGLGDEIILMDEEIVEDKEGRRRAFREAEDVGRMEWDALIRQLDRNGSTHRR
ncbi:MAG: class II aldolase [Rhodospirillaceae bacterium]|nr:class II aldolase [Rhodospirillaceae bacterium]